MEEKDLIVIKKYLLDIGVPQAILDNINSDVFSKIFIKSLSSSNLCPEKRDDGSTTNQAHLDMSISYKDFFLSDEEEEKEVYINLLSNNIKHLENIDEIINGKEFEKRGKKYTPRIRKTYSKSKFENFIYLCGKATVNVGRTNTTSPQVEIKTPNSNDEFSKARKLLYKEDVLIFLKYKSILDQYLVICMPKEELTSVDKKSILLRDGNKIYNFKNINEKKCNYDVLFKDCIILENLNMTDVPYQIVKHYKETNNIKTYKEIKDKFKNFKGRSKDFILEKTEIDKLEDPARYYRPSVREYLETDDGIKFSVDTQWYGKSDKNNFDKYITDILKLGYIVQKSKQKGINKIFYGAPGTGKSDYVDKMYYDCNAKRVTFHPEYTYNDFVGCIRPVLNEEKHLTYKFIPGIFTEILVEALEDSDNMYTLIIEEINRANSAAVFGDLFQLLDRNEGVSIYRVNNKDIYDIVKSIRGYKYNDGSVYIPCNLNIIATMNTADQNAFVMDTAFKRRWEFEYIPVEFRETHKFKDKKIKDLNITWEIFVTQINKYIMSKDNEDLMITEDKQIGPYFVKENELDDSKKFAYKVLLYLWDDVFKMDKYRLFNENTRTFSMLVSNFQGDNPVDIFSSNFKKQLVAALDTKNEDDKNE